MNKQDIDARFAAWLRDEVGVDEPRRIVRSGPSGILVSKFEEGFAARLHETIAGLPELFEESEMRRLYALAGTGSPGATRVGSWHEAARQVLASAVANGRLTGEERAEVLAGIDSVAALLDSVLWTGPLVGDVYSPGPAELDAYREAHVRMDSANSLFTRFYGTFEGAPVLNHCPGAQLARRLVAQAWAICTDTAPAA